VIAGLAIHMALAIAIGVGLVLLWQLATGQGAARANEFVFMVAALIVIWTLNFFVVLPLISPDFVALVPYPVSLISKVLFGLASATVLQSNGRDRVPVILRAQAR
jgi:hypothetical protein